MESNTKMNSNIDACKIIDLPNINDFRGNLIFVESGNQIHFDIQPKNFCAKVCRFFEPALR